MRTYHIDGTLPDPESGRLFVFGSNDRGWHGWGAAKLAAERYGAIRYQASGLMGQSYGIPTKYFNYSQKKLVPRSLEDIVADILVFCEFTKSHPDLRFFVTSVACGLAGYRYEKIAPHFKGAINCSFPEQWEIFLEIE